MPAARSRATGGGTRVPLPVAPSTEAVATMAPAPVPAPPARGTRPAASSSRVGVRELRQNLSVYLRRVKQGESLEVLERGHVVAALVPLASGASVTERLVASGRAVRGAGSLADLPLPKGPVSDELSRALANVREERP